MAKSLRFDAETRGLPRSGVDALADAVKVGPKGRNAVLEKLTGPPTITNDGVTIAREIQLADPFANMGVAEVVQNPGAIVAPGFGDLAEGLVRPSDIA